MEYFKDIFLFWLLLLLRTKSIKIFQLNTNSNLQINIFQVLLSMLSTAPSFKLTHEIMTRRFMLYKRGILFYHESLVHLKERELKNIIIMVNLYNYNCPMNLHKSIKFCISLYYCWVDGNTSFNG